MWDRPLVVQSDRTLLLEVSHSLAEEARMLITQFAELLKSPDYIHTYQISTLSLWNACALGLTAETVIAALESLSRYSIPPGIHQFIAYEMGKFGKLILKKLSQKKLQLTGDPKILQELRFLPGWLDLAETTDKGDYKIEVGKRGEVKQFLARQGLPVSDCVGYETSPSLIEAKWPSESPCLLKPDVRLRPYQTEAVQAILKRANEPVDSSGVILLPCGSGKTLVGLAILGGLNVHTLVVAPNLVALRQWMREAVERLELPEELYGEYSSRRREIRPITFTTYQMMSFQKKGKFPHFTLLNQQPWGLLLYDEVQLLPAPMFRLCAAVQGIRRIGLTATLIREDGAETDVFSLIGPKRYEAPWRVIEKEGYLANVKTIEISVAMSQEDRLRYLTGSSRMKHRMAAENARKIEVVKQLIHQHPSDQILIIGNYINQLKEISRSMGVPLLTGQTSESERQRLYEQFRCRAIRCLVVSRVANVAVDLPDASVAIQVSGQFGSRQEEAQRLGRILRPNADGQDSYFYSLVSSDTLEQERAAHRQLFLTEQGYSYEILSEQEWHEKVTTVCG